MDEVAAVVSRTLDVGFTKVVELLPAGDDLLVRAGVGRRTGVVGNETECAGRESLAGYTPRAGAPVVSDDLAADTRFDRSAVVREHGIASGAAVVIGGRRGPFGVLAALSPRPGASPMWT